MFEQPDNVLGIWRRSGRDTPANHVSPIDRFLVCTSNANVFSPADVYASSV